MSEPLILDGKKVAESVYQRLLLEVSLLPVVPRIVFLRVGEDPASQSYVRSKEKRCLELGLRGETIVFSESVSEDEVIGKILSLNRDKDVNGILVQLPLPKHIDKARVLRSIDPYKDVDGLHPENAGLLLQGKPRFIPCTPAGIIELLKFYNIPVAGKRVAVLGRSEIVGRPVAQLLTNHDATVTVCHSKTQNLTAELLRSEIVVAAIGKPKLVQANMVSSGVVIVDVGINRVDGQILGDVDFDTVKSKASAISPVPGGVGPMTIAMLMKNLVLAATLQSQKN
ncbi:MAG: bifunctional 5,10-methylenetetrahydrofolate dehydrogenase/5,10-methenyltetrahydrofolate cyclohydrolase [Proteobacteria bacterium]|nr:bifunctional 5,10-methylenetetrahydrofolate dehydrogenase/5,10-methenyltetrahydrofolate cyclohydrolase [Pseudomonadota bacterium]NBY21205.1 bifunctional 5,10-methylenetetrahydrofolate dehydrogenase/5,10-methenyltetrahydrofolate cyclohydrolase [bacterium]